MYALGDRYKEMHNNIIHKSLKLLTTQISINTKINE